MSPHHPTTTLRRRLPRNDGDVHIGSMGGDVRPAPGSRTAEGQQATAELMEQVLDRVARRLRRRST